MYIDTYTSRCIIFKDIPIGAKVLEIGCGSGRLANLLSLKKKCKVYCIEKDPVFAAIAKNKCVDMQNIDIETQEPPFVPQFFDCIILGNVLEHMRDPSIVLRSLGKYLSKDGFIIYSVPNIVNWHSRSVIFSGRFEYEDSGVFDRTHLRFFNLKTAKELASEGGFKIIWIDVTPSIYFYKEKLNFMWYALAKYWKNLFSDEFIIKVVPRS